MRKISSLHPTDQVPVPPDTVQTLLLTGGSSAQALDWQTSTGAVANAAAAGVGIIRVTPLTTAGAAFHCFLNLFSTAAAVASSGTSISSSGVNHPVINASAFQVAGGSTGFSVAAYTSGVVMIEQWGK
jgi:hypothetical protein